MYDHVCRAIPSPTVGEPDCVDEPTVPLSDRDIGRDGVFTIASSDSVTNFLCTPETQDGNFVPSEEGRVFTTPTPGSSMRYKTPSGDMMLCDYDRALSIGTALSKANVSRVEVDPECSSSTRWPVFWLGVSVLMFVANPTMGCGFEHVTVSSDEAWEIAPRSDDSYLHFEAGSDTPISSEILHDSIDSSSPTSQVCFQADDAYRHFVPTKAAWCNSERGCDLASPNRILHEVELGSPQPGLGDSSCPELGFRPSYTIGSYLIGDDDLVDPAHALPAVSNRVLPSLDVDAYLVDTGCGHDLISKDMAAPFPDHILPRKFPLPINTAGGLSQSDSVFVHRVAAISDTSHATVMDSTPPVLTVGGRAPRGFSHLWVGG